MDPRGLPRGRLACVTVALLAEVFLLGFADATPDFGGLPLLLVCFFAAKLSSTTACAAASRETGTLKGEEET